MFFFTSGSRSSGDPPAEYALIRALTVRNQAAFMPRPAPLTGSGGRRLILGQPHSQHTGHFCSAPDDNVFFIAGVFPALSVTQEHAAARLTSPSSLRGLTEAIQACGVGGVGGGGGPAPPLCVRLQLRAKQQQSSLNLKKRLL